MAAKFALVEQIKQLQRDGAKEQWGFYCDQNAGKGKRDPNKHDEAFLSAFISSYNTGVRFEEQVDTDLVSQVKAIQREGGKEQWWAYCDQWGVPDDQGRAIRDPAKHDESFLSGFISSYNPTNNSTAGAGNSNLGDLIKEGQRGSVAFKNAWSNYCGENGNGKNDPTKYNKSFIVSFLDYLAGGTGTADSWGGNAGSWGSAGGTSNKKGGGAGGPYGGGKGKGGGGGGGGNLNQGDLGLLLKLLQNDSW